MSSSESGQFRKAVTFRDLHQHSVPFVLANAWDAGTARLLTKAGFAALGTTSAGLAFSLGLVDGANRVDRELTLHNAGQIVAATPLPVSADLESGFADTSAEVEQTILRAAEAGLVGGSIEDATGTAAAPIRPLDEAVDRVRHAVRAARSLPFPFTLTARAENFLYGNPDLDDTIRRLCAYAEAGADVLYAPGLPDRDTIRMLCARVPRPVNVLASGQPPLPSVTEFAELGARRISLGSLLPRVALTRVQHAAREILDFGTFTCAEDAQSYPATNQLISADPPTRD
ncbi:MAG TPA: isocitrate lyase/phosphoenolpyruvate mutase family protein [Pseudonocardiaceae bacterium]|nr:isocitrate lyase/phosphoenolpyruvate mutase family protein [Pseudonocardiaceae bacterium]